ncbi:MAG: tyrosine-type recombinase/integrase [Lachnospiraceae bacterium]|nr:tyrosine-type recombinase/integrase [Lachnospiraceae bacterium]
MTQNYYKDDPIIHIPLVKLEYDTLQEWALRIVKEKKLTKKQYYNLTVIFRQSLEYAVQKKLIPENPFSKVHVDAKLFRSQKKPADETQVFLTDEQPKIVAEAWEDFRKTGAVACLAVPLAFQTGMRLGEIVAIREEDIQGNYLHVQRMEVRQVQPTGADTWSKQTFTVADYTKSEAGDRKIYLSKNAREIIRTVIESNREHGYSDEGYLFINEKGRVRSEAVDCRIRKYCRHIGIAAKATHKIRKTYISTLIDSGLNINEIRKLAGHEDERTTYKNYCFNRMTNSETENLLEKALS